MEQAILETLRELFAIDQVATTKLLEARVFCSSEIEKHPGITCVEEGGLLKVGLLGVLNGVLHKVSPKKRLAAVYDDTSEELVRLDIINV